MFLVLILQGVFCGAFADRPIAFTLQGRIQGTEIRTFEGRQVFAYLSVPYASSPVGRRFQEMNPPVSWSGLKDCGKPSPSCLYLNNKREINGVEDCLFLNIYTPVKSANGFAELLPVIVYIHGGAYNTFSGSLFGPRYLLDKNVLLVTFNFRIGVLGFLSSGDHVLPGNLGLKDQVLALKWIRSNIRHFGGDPHSVTLYGMSSGASLVFLHYFSPLSRGLFHRGFISGGTPLAPWAFQKNPYDKFQTVAKYLRCPLNNSLEVIACLEKVSAERLASTLKILQHGLYPVAPVGPVVDTSSSSPFLYEYPFESLYSTRMYNAPLLISDAYESGAVPFAADMDSNSILSLLNTKWTSEGPRILDFVDALSLRYRDFVLAKVRQFYIRQPVANYSDLPYFLKMLSDRQYLSGAAKAAALTSRCQSEVYFFIFNYRGSRSTSESYGSPVFTYGASHVDDTLFILNISSDVSLEKSPRDVAMIKKMTSMMESFSRTGVPSFGPTVIWQPVHKHSSVYGDISLLQVDGPAEFKMISQRNFGNNELWDVLPLNEPWAGRVV